MLSGALLTLSADLFDKKGGRHRDRHGGVDRMDRRRHGKPWGMVNFDHKWRDTFLAAGLRDTGLHFHDIRGTTRTVLGEAQAPPSEIAAMLGWTVSTVNRMLDTYQAMTASMSDSAVAKPEARAKCVRKRLRKIEE